MAGCALAHEADDDPDTVPARAHIQVAERIRLMERAHELPAFERNPPRM
jgi:hypothetical protein